MPGLGLLLSIVAGLALSAAHADFIETCKSEVSSSAIPMDSIKVVTLNVAHGRRTSLNQMLVSRKRTMSNLDEAAGVFDRIEADVVALQEADRPSAWSGKFDHVGYLLERSGFTCAIHGRHAKARLYDFGTALLTRHQFDEAQSLQFEPSPPTTTKGLVSARVVMGEGDSAKSLTVVSVHLDFSREKVREAQIQEMVAHLAAIDTPLIVMGDLNSEWDAEQSNVRGFAEKLGLIAYEPNSARMGTYKSVSGKRLDWILISSDLEFVAYRMLSDMLSDHLAVYAEVQYRKGGPGQ